MSNDSPTRALEAALAALEETLARGGAVSLELADGVLVPAGTLLLEGSLEGLERTFEHLAALVAPSRTAWVEAVGAAIERAGEAHWRLLADDRAGREALIASRTGLEARMAVVETLGGDVDPRLRERLDASDAELERRLDG